MSLNLLKRLFHSFTLRVSATNLIPTMRFARVLNRDIEAVYNAIELTWRNGQAESQINRLKTIKRAMYGRAGLELLRA